MIQEVLPQLPCLVSRHNCCACPTLLFRTQPTPRTAPKLSLNLVISQVQIKGRKPQPKLPRRTRASTVAIQGLNSTLQLSPSTAFKNSFLLNLGSKSFLCDRIEGHKIVAATRHLDLHVRSRPSQKRTTPQPQKWVRFRGPKTGPQTAACGESCELIRKRRSLHKQSEIRLQNWIHLAAPFLGSPSLLHFGKNPAPRPPQAAIKQASNMDFSSPHGSHAGSTGFDRSLKARATSLRSTRQEPLAPPRPLLPVPVFCFDFGSVFRTPPRIITLSIRCSRLRYMSEESAPIPARN